LLENAAYAIAQLTPFGLYAPAHAAIITLQIPPGMDIRKAALLYHEQDIFINPVEYPAVPVHKQRFRISVMTDHTKEDINKLVAVTASIWQNPQAYA